MDNKPYRGILITIEGIDGSGKSSASQALYTALKANYEVILTKEPGATTLGKQLRTLLHERTFPLTPQAEFLLFAADRAQHIQEVVLPALQNGTIVISDRMADSSLAYQGYGRGLSTDWIQKINDWAMNTITPDLIVYLEIDYLTAHKRLSERQEKLTTFEQEQTAFFERVIKGFETIFHNCSNVITIDAASSPDTVHTAIIEKVTDFISTTTNSNATSCNPTNYQETARSS